jgi:hypothetical protein
MPVHAYLLNIVSSQFFILLFCSIVHRGSRGRTASYLSRPHTDPDVRNYRIRLLSYIFARVKHAP